MAVNDAQVIAWVLEAPRTLAVVGLSDNPERPSYHVSAEMQSRGHKVVPVSPKGEQIHGEQVYRSLLEIPFPVDVVQLFRAPQYAMDAIREIEQMTVKPRVLWMQEGVINAEAVAAAEAIGIAAIQDRCMYKMALAAEGKEHP